MRNPIDKIAFGGNLKLLREKAALSQGDLAERVNKITGSSYNRGTISKWENGSYPSLGLIPVLADILSVPIIYFFNFDSHLKNEQMSDVELSDQVDFLKGARSDDPITEIKRLWKVIDNLTYKLKDKSQECDKLKEVNRNVINLLSSLNT